MEHSGTEDPVGTPTLAPEEDALPWLLTRFPPPDQETSAPQATGRDSVLHLHQDVAAASSCKKMSITRLLPGEQPGWCLLTAH